jgi:hypothetical protein
MQRNSERERKQLTRRNNGDRKLTITLRERKETNN